MVIQSTSSATTRAASGGGAAVAAAPSASPPPVQGASAQPPQPAPSAADVESAVRELQQAAEASGANLQFSVDKEINKTIVKVVDSSTGDLIRQIPSEELVTIARNLDKVQGLLLNQKA